MCTSCAASSMSASSRKQRKSRAFDYLRSEVYVLKFSAWFVWDLCRVQRSRGKDVRWPTELSMRMAPCPTTRSSGLRAPGATRSRSGELVVWPLRGGGSWQIAPEDPGRSSGSWQTWPEAPGGGSSGSWQTAPETPSGSWQAQTWWSSQCWQNWPNE